MIRRLIALYMTVIGVFGNLQLLIAVIPLEVGHRMGTASAGIATGALAGGTVLMEASMPYILARVSHRTAVTAGLLLLAIPAFAYPLTQDATVVNRLPFIRLVSFAI